MGNSNQGEFAMYQTPRLTFGVNKKRAPTSPSATDPSTAKEGGTSNSCWWRETYSSSISYGRYLPPAYTFYRSGSAKQPLKVAGSGLIAKGTDTRKSNPEPAPKDNKQY